jgi:hypothetical protein
MEYPIYVWKKFDSFGGFLGKLNFINDKTAIFILVLNIKDILKI